MGFFARGTGSLSSTVTVASRMPPMKMTFPSFVKKLNFEGRLPAPQARAPGYQISRTLKLKPANSGWAEMVSGLSKVSTGWFGR